MATNRRKNRPYYRSLFVSLIMLCFSGHAQNRVQNYAKDTTKGTSKIIVITKIRRQQVIKKDTSNLTVMVGNVGLLQGNTKLYCDSLIQNSTTNIIEAFGNVHINDEDNVQIYSNYLLYNARDRKAFLKDNVKLIDRNNATLTTKQLNYDLNTKIGNYSLAGKVVNNSTVLTSMEGVYYAQTHDAIFKKKVILIDTDYTVKTDTLLYNTVTQLATFTVPTEIVSGNRKIFTTDGYYNKRTKRSYFGKRPTIIDSSSTLIADEVAYDDSSKFGEARGKVVSKDTAQGTVLVCNNLKLNTKNDSYLATIHPIMIVKQDKDSLFIAADTLYSARLSDRLNSTDSGKVSVDQGYIKDSSYTNAAAIRKDTTVPKAPENKYVNEGFSGDSTAYAPRYVEKNGRIVKEVPVSDAEKLKAMAMQNGKKVKTGAFSRIMAYGPPPTHKKPTKSSTNPASELTTTTDSSQTKVNEDAALAVNTDQKETPENNIKHTSKKQKKKTTTVLVKNEKSPTVDKKREKQQNDRKNHYLEAYYHVRIYSDSMQAVGDSLFYSFKDSTFRLFKNPIVWSQDNQLLGDTIYLNTENKKPKHIYVFENAFAISRAEGIETDNLFYNQLKGRTIEGWFTGGDIDSIHTKGSPAESVYYMVGDDKKYTGVNKITSSVIDMYYADKKPNKVAARNDIKGTVYPMQHVNHEDLKLRGFKWYDNRRPKNKYELLGMKTN